MLRDIPDQEWNEYVKKCTTGEWPVPAGFVSDKNNWVCRAIVGRVLYFTKDVEGALAVLSTVVNDVEVYDAANSVNVEFDDMLRGEIVARMVKEYGKYTDDPNSVQYGQNNINSGV